MSEPMTRTPAGRVLMFASDAENKLTARIVKAVNDGNANEAKVLASEALAWRMVRDHAYQEASEDERAEWVRKLHGDDK